MINGRKLLKNFQGMLTLNSNEPNKGFPFKNNPIKQWRNRDINNYFYEDRKKFSDKPSKLFQSKQVLVRKCILKLVCYYENGMRLELYC